jgi:cold shock CspA family protein
VDAHYFRGRLPAHEAQSRQKLLTERLWDDVLMRQGVVTHYLPLAMRDGKVVGEKGIDVWFALEAFELAIYKRFNVSVLIACDSDYIPLVRKLNTLGTRVMLLGWDFSYVDEAGTSRNTVTSVGLLDEVTYPVLMHTLIDDKTRRNDPVINNLFLQRREGPVRETVPDSVVPPSQGELNHGKIQNLKEGYGFITPELGGANIFFFWSDVFERDFNDLRVGDVVEYAIGANDRGPAAKQVRVLTHQGTSSLPLQPRGAL